MRLFYKILLNLSVVVSFLVIFFTFQERPLNKSSFLFNYAKNDKQINNVYRNWTQNHFSYLQNAAALEIDASQRDYNIWCIFSKANALSPLRQKFTVFASSLLKFSSVPLSLHVVTDNVSLPVAEDVLHRVKNVTGKNFTLRLLTRSRRMLHDRENKRSGMVANRSLPNVHISQVRFYDVRELAEKISDLVVTMRSYFTSQPDSYYSDALFFLSIGLYRIAVGQVRAAMIDVDTKFHTDVKLLFDEFDNFGNETLLGVAPEQSPVYRHVLYMYRAKYRDTEFGKPLSQNGNPGVNSGVLLLHLQRMRESEAYGRLLQPGEVKRWIDKYMFRGHLGDQDWYTLLSQEHKQLVYLLDCTWNRQLCQWWNHHGYKDIFNMFYQCNGTVKISHGNCNTRIP